MVPYQIHDLAFWERAFLALLTVPHLTPAEAASRADEADIERHGRIPDTTDEA